MPVAPASTLPASFAPPVFSSGGRGACARRISIRPVRGWAGEGKHRTHAGRARQGPRRAVSGLMGGPAHRYPWGPYVGRAPKAGYPMVGRGSECWAHSSLPVVTTRGAVAEAALACGGGRSTARFANVRTLVCGCHAGRAICAHSPCEHTGLHSTERPSVPVGAWVIPGDPEPARFCWFTASFIPPPVSWGGFPSAHVSLARGLSSRRCAQEALCGAVSGRCVKRVHREYTS